MSGRKQQFVGRFLAFAGLALALGMLASPRVWAAQAEGPKVTYKIKFATCSISPIRCNTCISTTVEKLSDEKLYCGVMKCTDKELKIKVCQQVTSDSSECGQLDKLGDYPCEDCRAWFCEQPKADGSCKTNPEQRGCKCATTGGTKTKAGGKMFLCAE